MAYDPNRQSGTEPRVIFSPVLELIYASNLVHSCDACLAGFEVDWRSRQREELNAEARSYLAFATGALEWATLSLGDFLLTSESHDDWEKFAAQVLAEPIDDFLFVLMNRDIPFEEIARLRCKPDRVDKWMDRVSCYSRMSPEAGRLLFTEPEAFRARLLAFVAGNRTRNFETRLEELRPRYESRIAAMQERLRGKDPIAVAEEMAKKPFRHPRHFHTFTFSPSHFLGRNHLYLLNEGDLWFSFSLSCTEGRPSEQAREFSERIKVLGDRTRLDILRLLSEEPSYGKVIAERLKLTTATVSRQLDQLKGAGLVAEDRADANNVKLVHLRSEAVKELFGQLQRFLGIPKG